MFTLKNNFLHMSQESQICFDPTWFQLLEHLRAGTKPTHYRLNSIFISCIRNIISVKWYYTHVTWTELCTMRYPADKYQAQIHLEGMERSMILVDNLITQLGKICCLHTFFYSPLRLNFIFTFMYWNITSENDITHMSHEQNLPHEVPKLRSSLKVWKDPWS